MRNIVKSVVALFAIVSLALVTGCSSIRTSEAPSGLAMMSDTKLEVLEGVWVSNGWVVTIENRTIAIDIVDGDLSWVYWYGTFNGSSGTVVSVGDREVLGNSLLGSTLDTKEFEIEGDTITFEFSALGETATIVVAKI